jgi:hypothetical protein
MRPHQSANLGSLQQVVVRTSDLPGAGTDAEPWLELIGSNGKCSGRRVPRGSAADPFSSSFSRGAVDRFDLVCGDLGELTECVVGHDGRGSHPGWHLEQVRGSTCMRGHLLQKCTHQPQNEFKNTPTSKPRPSRSR